MDGFQQVDTVAMMPTPEVGWTNVRDWVPEIKTNSLTTRNEWQILAEICPCPRSRVPCCDLTILAIVIHYHR
jgi:hypothetical protein